MEQMVPIVVGGAAGACISTYAVRAGDWLIERYRSHSPKVQAEAQKNAQNYLDRLAQRVERLEQEYPSAKDLIDEALDHPSTALLMQKALISAAATDNETRQTLLTELIAQRLTAGPEDNIALIGSAAVDVIGSLSVRQIQILGAITRLYNPPYSEVQSFSSQEEFEAALLSWWGDLDALLQGLESTKTLDFDHLEGVSCIRVNSIYLDLARVLKGPFDDVAYAVDLDIFKKEPWWERFQYLWNCGLRNVSATSIGFLIGMLYDEMIL